MVTSKTTHALGADSLIGSSRMTVRTRMMRPVHVTTIDPTGMNAPILASELAFSYSVFLN
jgi:hypothetical protein